jgi:hypothetical protein
VKSGFVLVGEVVGVAGDPAGDLADGARGGRQFGRGGGGAQWLKIAADGAAASAISPFAEFGEESGGVGDPVLVDALVEVRDEFVEGSTAPAWAVDELLGAGRVAVFSHGLAVHAQVLGDGGDRQAFVGQLVDTGVSFSSADVGDGAGRFLGRRLVRRRGHRRWVRGGISSLRGGAEVGFDQVSAVRTDSLLCRAVQVPPVCYLSGLWRTRACSFGVGAGRSRQMTWISGCWRSQAVTASAVCSSSTSIG